jgi:WD40 repeat protein
MAKQPEDRYQTPAEAAEALVPLTSPGGTPTPARLPTIAEVRPPSTDIVEVQPVAKEPAAAPPASEGGAVPEVAAGERVAASVYNWITSSEARQVVEAESATRLALLKGHQGWVTAVAFSPDRNLLVSGGVEGTVRLWNFSKSGPEDQALPPAHRGEINALAITPDSRTLASGGGSADGLVWLWEVGGSKPVQRAVLAGHKGAVEALAFSPDGKQLISGGADHTVRLWDLVGAQARERAVFKGHTDAVKAVAFSPDGKLAATGAQDGTVRLWNVGKSSSWSPGKLFSRDQSVLHVGRRHIRSLAFSPDAPVLAMGGIDQVVRLWDLTGAQPHERLVFKGHLGVIKLIATPAEDKTLLTVDDRGLVLLWDVAGCTMVRCWQLPKGILCSVAATFDGRYLAAGNSDGTVAVFRLYARKEEA